MSLIGKTVGNYRVTSKIGEGGMGAVYLGEHPLIGKKVAIKTLHPDLAMKEDIVSRFFTEAKSVNDIAHPNIVDIVDFGKTRDDSAAVDIVYFVMEFLDGEGLNSRLKREGVTAREAVHIMVQCCSALSASHKKNIVHRDLKPENIYLINRGDDRNYVKLLDFGIAKLTGENTGSQHQTRAGLVMGTPAYMSPEQCEGKGNIDWRSDVYSIGVVMYEMLTGRVPFTGEGFGELLIAHLTKDPPLPSTIRPDVPAALEAIVMHAMEKDKNRRFQSMDEMVYALEHPNEHQQSYGSPSGRPAESAGATLAMEDDGSDLMAQVRAMSAQPSRTTGQGNRPITGQGPRPTTLSGAAAEVAQQGGGKSKAPLFAALGLLVVGGGGAGVFFMTQQKGPAAPTAPAASPAPAIAANDAQQDFRILVDSDPKGAKVYRAGVSDPVGTTPCPITGKKGEPEFEIMLKLDGYETKQESINPAAGKDKLVLLTKAAAPVAPQPVVAAPQPVTPVAAPHAGGHRSGGGGGGGAVKKERPTAPTGGGGKKDKDDVLEPDFLK